MAENKVVIRINYDRNIDEKPRAVAKTVTVWHYRRVAAALAALVLLAALLAFWFSGRKTPDAEPARSLSAVIPQNSAAETNPSAESAFAEHNAGSPHEHGRQKNGPENITPATNNEKRPFAIILDKKIIRASLNTSIKDNEPYEQVKSPIMLNENQTIQLFYFNQVKDIKDGALYHYWSKNGKIVYKKQLKLKEGRGKIISGKSMSYNDSGKWQIQLVDKKGKVFSEVNFIINNE